MIRHALQDDRTDIVDTWLQRGGNIDVVSISSGSLLHSVYLGSAQYWENIEFLLQRGKCFVSQKGYNSVVSPGFPYYLEKFILKKTCMKMGMSL